MKFSLVVPTVGRPADLRRFIEHLRLQRGRELDLREIELIVVDQSGQPDTGELLAQHSGYLRIIHLPMVGRGASRARNFGWGFAYGEIITFPDDDCHYPMGFLEQVSRKFENTDIDAISVRVDFFTNSGATAGVITPRNVLKCCSEVGFFARRKSMGDLRYDELMGVGAESPWNSDEGPDLLLRMIKQGLRIDYCPDLCIHHPDPRRNPDEWLQERNFKYSRGRGYLLRKHKFPALHVVMTMLRSLSGSLLMAATAQMFWARYYFRSFVGKWQGFRAGKGAPGQVVTAPLIQERPGSKTGGWL